MSERPILFSDSMVRAIISGAKTQTRRVMTPQPVEDGGTPVVGSYHPIVVRRGIEEPGPERWGASTEEQSWPCPCGQPGDRLWVREAWGCFDRESYGGAKGYAIAWRATHPALADGCEWIDGPDDYDGSGIRASEKWCPSIHMPRWASRLTLEVTSVRVERVQSISEEDARAEGVEVVGPIETGPGALFTARRRFETLWDSINGKREGCSWEANPWVWCVGFKRVEVER